MTFWNKFLETIDKVLAKRGRKERVIEHYEELAKLNPSRFYIENVRSVMDIPYEQAKEVIKEGIEEGLFIEGVELICPDGAIVSVPDPQNIPETVECNEMENGFYEPVERATSDLDRKPYYRLTSVR